METLSNIFLAPQFWGFATPIVVATIAWMFNERSKLKWNQHAKREERYSRLIEAIEGFYVTAEDPHGSRQEFLKQLNQSWLYCPDEVINCAYAFLDAVKVGSTSSPDDKERLFGDLVVSIRKDLLNPTLVRKTSLTNKDYRHLMVTK
jgi:hypothetical protein